METFIAAAFILLACLGLYVWGNPDARVLRDRQATTKEPDNPAEAAGMQSPDRTMPTSLNAEPLLLASFLIALAATLGALFIGEVLGQMPCMLCWYQRIAMFPLVPVLAIGLWRADAGVRFYALPLVATGLAISLWHSGLYAGLIPEGVTPCAKDGPSCSDRTHMSILALPIPYLSLGAFTAIALCLGLAKGKQS